MFVFAHLILVVARAQFWGAMAALGYYYMVTAWGGYIFLINIIPAHVIFLIIAGRYSHRLYEIGRASCRERG